MTLWILVGVMAALAAGLLLRAGRRESTTPEGREDRIAALIASRAEIDRDLAAGRLGEPQAVEARLEVDRRLLEVADDAPADATHAVGPGRLAPAIAVAAPLAALLLYLALGTPGLPGQPLAGRTDIAGAAGQDVAARAALLAELEALRTALEADPADQGAWLRLADALLTLDRPGDAAQALARAIDLDGDNATLHGRHGEALARAADGTITPAALAAFATALELDPGEPRARYYTGLAEFQAGAIRPALEIWAALEIDSPPDAPWLPLLRERMQRIAGDNDIDLDDIRVDPGPRAGPTPGSPDAIAALPPAEREAAIRSMVDRLAARLADDPDDAEGWHRLAIARSVLGEDEAALAAWARVTALRPDDIGLLTDRGEAILRARSAGEDGPLPGDFIAVMEQIHFLDGRHPVALWYLGEVAARDGRADEARSLWDRLLEVMPPEAPQRATVEARIRALEGDEGGEGD